MMLAVWGAIEADFQRDYGIDLAAALPHMSWRRFSMLLMGLNPGGAVARAYPRQAQGSDDAGVLMGTIGGR